MKNKFDKDEDIKLEVSDNIRDLDFLKDEKFIQTLTRHFAIAHSQLAPAKQRCQSIQKLKRFCGFLSRMLIPNMAKLKQVPSIIDRVHIAESYKKIQSELNKIRKSAKHEGLRLTKLRQLLKKEKISSEFKEHEVEGICDDLKGHIRDATSKIVARRFNASSHHIRKLMASLAMEKTGIISIKKPK